MDAKQCFRERLFAWFAQNSRPLPWKGERDPYKIWLSEIILQQTRVEQGLPYYQKFIERYPTVRHLSDAPEDEVLKLWEGLGYYSRARNLHHTAKLIAGGPGGNFPDTYTGIRALKGVGDYTAAAIASFAFNLPHAVLDGNVFRVLARYFGIETPTDTSAAKKEFTALALELLDPARPGDFNQALMDFGATHCTPQKPKCPDCLLRPQCAAFQQNKVAELPVKSKQLVKKDRFFVYLVVHHKGDIFVQRRNRKDIWQNLWEFPLLELPVFPADNRELEALIWNRFFPENPIGQTTRGYQTGVNGAERLKNPPLPESRYGARIASISRPYRQTLTHRIVTAVFCEITFPDETPLEAFENQLFENCLRMSRPELKKNVAVPRVIGWYLQESALTLTLI